MTSYLKKSALFPPQIPNEPTMDLGMLVVIPAYQEAQLIRSLESIKVCTLPACAVEVIVVINDSEKDEATVFQSHQKTFASTKAWAKANSTDRLSFFILYKNQLPAKHAGVGLARKIGMDEAVFRLESLGKSDGIVLCYDADSTCQENYLQEVEIFFAQNPKVSAASIHYEHPLEGDKFTPEIYQAIIDYELHLRYYIQIQRWANFPFAYHTVGSSMAVRANAYQAQGGMNRRKAGEDFYFLHKFIPLGHFGEIKKTKMIPSPRISNRVPFGTGKSVGDILKSQEPYLTYAPTTFMDLKLFLEKVPDFYEEDKLKQLWSGFPESIQQFLESVEFQKKVQETRDNIGSPSQFVSRFYRWFNAFLLMKYVHFARDYFYPNVPIGEGANWLLTEIGEEGERKTERECLERLREVERS